MLDQYGMGAVSMVIILNEENLALKAENALLHERVKELDEIVEKWRAQHQKLCDKYYTNRAELEARKQHEKELEESFKLLTNDYLSLKADKKVTVAIKGGCKNGKDKGSVRKRHR